MVSEEHNPSPEVSFLFPMFDIAVSVNGHLEEYRLSRQAYVDIVEDDGIDPLNYVQLWAWFEEHLHEYLLDVVQVTGPVDTEKVKLIDLRITIVSGPDRVSDVIDCDGCMEEYQGLLSRATSDEVQEDD